IPFDAVYRIIRADSEERWVRARVVPEVAEDGTVVKLVGTLMDDTERVEAEYTHPDEVPLRDAARARVAAGHDTYEDERRYLRPDGTIAWALSHVTLRRAESGG